MHQEMRGSTSQMLSKRDKSSSESNEDQLIKPIQTAQPVPIFTSGFKKLKIENRITLVDEEDISYFEEMDKTFKGSSLFFKMTNNFYKKRAHTEGQDISSRTGNNGFSSNPRNRF